MVRLRQFSTSTLALYAVGTWIFPRVMAQDDGSENDDDEDNLPTGGNPPATTTADLGTTTTTTPTNTSVPTDSNTAPAVTTTPTIGSSITESDTSDPTISATNIPSSSLSTPSNTVPTKPALSSNTGDKNNTGSIAGGVVGALLGLAIIGAIAFWFLRKKRRSDREVFRPDSETDGYSNSSRLTSDPSNPMTEQSLPPRPPRHSYYDPKNQPIVY